MRAGRGGLSRAGRHHFLRRSHGEEDESEAGSSNWESGHNALAAAALKGTAAIYKEEKQGGKP